MNTYKCSNCGSEDVDVLMTVDSSEQEALSSDSQIIDCNTASRLFCRRCACISTFFEPEYSLRKFYENKYIISDRVQNHFAVINGSVTDEKHVRLMDLLFSSLPTFPETGSFLEIACGSGELLKKFTSLHPGWECFGIDPSCDSPDNSDVSGRVKFIRGLFDKSHFAANKFDIVIAHGFLNRSPTMPELINIRSICSEGAIVSIELMLLENSECLPYIWDHSYVFTQEVFEKYLSRAGFVVAMKQNIGSTYHYICKCDNPESILENIIISDEAHKNTLKYFKSHMDWWEKVRQNYIISTAVDSGKKMCLFGAGMYSAVLFNNFISDKTRVSIAIDENRSGDIFFGLPVIGLHEIDIDQYFIMVCCRSAYRELIKSKLESIKADYIILNS